MDGINFIDVREVICDKVVDFIANTRKKGFNEQVTREDVRKFLIQRGQEEDFIVAEKNGKIVAQACIQTYTPRIKRKKYRNYIL